MFSFSQTGSLHPERSFANRLTDGQVVIGATVTIPSAALVVVSAVKGGGTGWHGDRGCPSTVSLFGHRCVGDPSPTVVPPMHRDARRA